MLTTIVALCLTAAPPTQDEAAAPKTQGQTGQKPTQGQNTVKSLVKDAISEGPDLSKLPFTSDSIMQIVVANQPKIQGCYEEHLANKKNAPEGSLKTSFVISPDGLVKNAKVDRKNSSLKDPGLHDCVVAVLGTLSFPKPPDGKDHPIEFPFNLKAVH